jgi:hypothetical protein
LRKKSYCILNKQYSKDEYQELVLKIKQHMSDMPYMDKKGRVYKYGEFFPIEFSPWAYNESIAQEYFPLTREKIIEAGYRWREPDNKNYQPTILVGNFPEDITEVLDSLVDEVFECSHKGECNQGCTKAFRITQNELQFYRKIRVPIPLLCPACRTLERLKMRLGVKLYDRHCMCAGQEDDSGQYKNGVEHFHGESHCEEKFRTGFSTDGGDIVYCEKCYQQEVY